VVLRDGRTAYDGPVHHHLADADADPAGTHAHGGEPPPRVGLPPEGPWR
jgi:hypothetical protein